MDQKLLDALGNLSEALEQIASSLKGGGGKGGNSATTDALQSGNFTKEIKQINVGIKQLQSDNKKILKNQETIIQLSKKSSSNNKKSEFESAGGDPKKESNIKKGVGTILLIAVAVLAIGVAFKLVGGINFLSVVGLSIGIMLVAMAFEKVAALKMSLKEAAIVSASLVLMAAGITISSWIMKKITPISITQSLTAILIGVGFSMLSPAIGKIINAFGGMSWGSVIKASVGLVIVLPAIALGMTVSSWILKKITPIGFGQALTLILIGVGFSMLSPAIGKIIKAFKGMSWGQIAKAAVGLVLVLPAIALGMTLSSWILQKIKPISFSQAITAILIAAMFTVVSFGINKLLHALGGNSIGAMMKAIVFLPLVLPAIALGIVLSSYVLQKTQPVGFSQAFSAIMIALIFTVISFGLKNIVNAMGNVSVKSTLMIPLILPLIALAIAVSSKALAKVQPISLTQFITAIAISLIFVVIGFAVKLIGKSINGMNWGTMAKIPILFTLVSLAITASSHILSKAKAPEIMETIKIGLFGIALGFIVAAMMIPFAIISKFKIGVSDILKGSLAIIAIAGAIMVSSQIIALGKYTKYPSIGWSLGAGAAILTFGLAVLGLGTVIMLSAGLGLAAIGMGALAVIMVSGSITASSHILSRGKYEKYPGIGWALSVGGLMLAFGAAMLVLGIMPKVVIKDGVHAIKEVAKSIVFADTEVSRGKYEKYPGIGWAVTMSALMIGYAIGVAALGILPKIVVRDGIWALKEVAKSIHTTDIEVRKGKYEKYPGIGWAVTVSALMIGYAIGLAALGILPKVVVRDGAWALNKVARSILKTDQQVSKGKYEKYPGIGWSVTVSALMIGYAVGLAALGILPKVVVRDGAWALEKVARSIFKTDQQVSKGKYEKYPDIGWSVTVSALMIGYAVGLTALGILPKVVVRDGAWALEKVARSIFKTDQQVGKGKYKNYPGIGWSVTVSALMLGYAAGMTALGILPKMIVRDGVWALKKVAKSILTTDREIRKGKYKNYPSSDWALTVGLLMGGWATGMTVLGIMPKMIIRDGVWAIRKIAKSIVGTARIFTKNIGVFKDGPKKEWAEGVSMAIGAFAQVYSLVLKSGALNAILGSSVKPEDFGAAITTISSGIVEAAKFFGDPKLSSIWKPGPTKEWAEGIGIAIGAFSPVYAMLLKNAPGFLSKGGGLGPDEFANAIITVSFGIVAAASIFDANSAKFEEGKYPSVEWGKGVGAALKAFAPVFKALHEDVGVFTSGDEVINNIIKGIVSIAGAIVRVAKKFSGTGVSWTSYPDSKWSEGVKKAVVSYVDISNEIDGSYDSIAMHSMNNLVDNLARTARVMGKNSKYFEVEINPNFMKSISSNLFYYMHLAEKLKSKQGGLTGFLKGAVMGDPIMNIANGMVALANAYDKLSTSLAKVGKSMDGMSDKKISQMERMSRMITPKTGGGGISDTLNKWSAGLDSFVTKNVLNPAFAAISGKKMLSSDSANESPSVKPSASSKRSVVDKGGKDITKQNETIIHLLTDLNIQISRNLGPRSIISTYLHKKMADDEKKDFND